MWLFYCDGACVVFVPSFLVRVDFCSCDLSALGYAQPRFRSFIRYWCCCALFVVSSLCLYFCSSCFVF